MATEAPGSDNPAENLNNLGATAGKTTRELDFLRDALYSTTTISKSIDRQFNSLDRSLRSGGKFFKDLGGQLGSLTESLHELEDAAKADANADHDAIKTQIQLTQEKIKEIKVYQQARTVVAGIGNFLADAAKAQVTYAVDSQKTIIGGYQSGASAFKIAADLQGIELDQNTSLLSSVNTNAATVATGLIGLSVATGGTTAVMGGLAIGATQAISSLLEWANKADTDIKKTRLSTAAAEIDNATKAWQDAAKAGAYFTDGLMGLRNEARLAGLTQAQFTKLMSESNDDLRKFGGTATFGARKFAEVSNAMLPFRASLIDMGMSVDDIASGTAHYMGILQRVGNIQNMNAQELAEGSKEYLTNLAAVSATMGKDNAKKNLEDAERRLNEADVFNKIRQMSGGNIELEKRMTESFTLMMAKVPEGLKDAAMQYFTTGRVTNKELQESIGLVNREGIYRYLDTINQFIKSGDTNANDVIKANQVLHQDMESVASQVGRFRDAAAVGNKETNGALKLFSNLFSSTQADVNAKNQNVLKSITESNNVDTLGSTKAILQQQDLNLEIMKALDRSLLDLSGTIDDTAEAIRIRMKEIGFPLIGKLRGEKIGRFQLGGGPPPTTAQLTAPTVPTAPAPAPAPAPAAPAPAPATPIAAPPAAPQRYLRPTTPVSVAPATPTTATATPGMMAPQIPGGLQTNGRQGDGMISQELQDKLPKLAALFGNSIITSLNDAESFREGNTYPHKPPDKHGLGRAIDFQIPSYWASATMQRDPEAVKLSKEYVERIKSLGFSNVKDEYLYPNMGRTTAGHFHAELEKGAIVKASTGGTDVRVAEKGSNELIAPLKDGMLPGMRDLIGAINDLVDITSAHKSSTDKLIRVMS